MSKIYGVTVGTNISPDKIKREIQPVTSVNNKTPDSGGNVALDYNSIHIGAEAPSDDKVNVWIDTDEEPENPSAGNGGNGGATFIPSVSSDGVISWTNDGGLDNPAPVNIKGKDGVGITNITITEV